MWEQLNLPSNSIFTSFTLDMVQLEQSPCLCSESSALGTLKVWPAWWHQRPYCIDLWTMLQETGLQDKAVCTMWCLLCLGGYCSPSVKYGMPLLRHTNWFLVQRVHATHTESHTHAWMLIAPGINCHDGPDNQLCLYLGRRPQSPWSHAIPQHEQESCTCMSCPCFSSTWRAASFSILSCSVSWSRTCLVRSIRLPKLLRVRHGHLFMVLARHTLFKDITPTPGCLEATCQLPGQTSADGMVRQD